MPPDEFGAWAGAIGTFAAVVVALWVAISDTRRRDRQAADQLNRQARTVTARAELVPDEAPYGPPSTHHMAIIIENHGILSVTRMILKGVVTSVDDKPFADSYTQGVQAIPDDAGNPDRCLVPRRQRTPATVGGCV